MKLLRLVSIKDIAKGITGTVPENSGDVSQFAIGDSYQEEY